MRDTLLAEHLEATPEAVRAEVAVAGDRIVPVVDRLGGRLRDLRLSLPTWLRLVASPARLADLDEPLTASKVAEHLATPRQQRHWRTRLLRLSVVLGLLVYGFGVPMLGQPQHLALALGLLILAATGVGLLISLISDSERQAVQLALIILLASVFFGGLAIDRSHFTPLVQALSEFLPTTQATAVMQDLLLRGAAREPVRVAILATMSAVLFVLGLAWLRRELSPRS